MARSMRIRGGLGGYLARSAKVAERAICFTDRNFYPFLARSANLPEGLSIFLALISFFFF